MSVDATVRYRLAELPRGPVSTRFIVTWKCGENWLLVFGPASEQDCRNWLDIQIEDMDQIVPDLPPKNKPQRRRFA